MLQTRQPEEPKKRKTRSVCIPILIAAFLCLCRSVYAQEIPPPAEYSTDQLPFTQSETTVPETPPPERENKPVAVTTSEPKAEITAVPEGEDALTPIKNILFILIICILAVVIISLIVAQIRLAGMRKRKKKRKR